MSAKSAKKEEPASKEQNTKVMQETPKEKRKASMVPKKEDQSGKNKKKKKKEKKKEAEYIGLVKYKRVPDAQPLTALCFDVPGYEINHHQVLAAARESLKEAGTKHVTISRLQFINRVCITGGRANNRWILFLSDLAARRDFIKTGITLQGRKFEIRVLDDVMREEYQLYMKKEKNKKKK